MCFSATARFRAGDILGPLFIITIANRRNKPHGGFSPTPPLAGCSRGTPGRTPSRLGSERLRKETALLGANLARHVPVLSDGQQKVCIQSYIVHRLGGWCCIQSGFEVHSYWHKEGLPIPARVTASPPLAPSARRTCPAGIHGSLTRSALDALQGLASCVGSA